MSELLPCPFCGEQPIHRFRIDGDEVLCKCGASIEVIDLPSAESKTKYKRQSAVEAWNKRYKEKDNG